MRMMMRAVVLAGLLGLWGPGTESVQIDKLVPYSEDYTYQRNCYVTLKPPTKPQTLRFCKQHNELSCCAPAQDEQNQKYFTGIFDVGLSCTLRGDLTKYPFAILYCMNCDPDQPRYVRNLPYFPLLTYQETLNFYPLVSFPSWRVGKANMPLDCFTVPTDGSLSPAGTAKSYDINSYQECYATRRLQVLLSREWMIKQFTIYPQVMSILDGCMIQKSAPCLDNFGTIVPNRERFVCGNDLVNPGIFYGQEAAPPAYTAGLPGMCALNGFKANGLLPDDENCRVLYLERAINEDDLGTPGIAENFGLRIVENRLCTDAEYNEWASKFLDNLQSSFVNETTINYFNPHLANGPTCRMTKAQVMDSSARFAFPPKNLTPDFVQDELCYDAAGDIPVTLSLVLLGALLVLLL